MKENKYALFTEDELYMLKRQAMESSYEIVMSGKYGEAEIKLHNDLLNGILKELNRRHNS